MYIIPTNNDVDIDRQIKDTNTITDLLFARE